MSSYKIRETGAALKALYEVAGDREIDVLSELIVRAGLERDCPTCDNRTAVTVSGKCEHCGAKAES